MILTHGANSLPRGGGGMTVNIGGRKYPIVQIGNQVWLAENLDFKFDVNGSQIPIGLDGTSSSDPRANYYDNDESAYGVNGNKYGLLYNWIAVKYLEDNKSSLIPGWHVPSSKEKNELAEAVGGANIAGTKLKSTTGWSWGAGTDDYGFSAFPAGYYDDRGFFNLGSAGYFWTAESSSSNGKAWRVDTGAKLEHFITDKFNQFSVRLVKDA